MIELSNEALTKIKENNLNLKKLHLAEQKLLTLNKEESTINNFKEKVNAYELANPFIINYKTIKTNRQLISANKIKQVSLKKDIEKQINLFSELKIKFNQLSSTEKSVESLRQDKELLKNKLKFLINTRI